MTDTVGSRGDGPARRNERAIERRYPSTEAESREFPWGDVRILVERTPTAPRSPADGDDQHTDNRRFRAATRLGGHPPMNEYQALMETAPGGTPRTHATELLAVREAIADALDALPAVDRFIFDGVFTRRQSLATVGRRLGWGRMRVMRARNRITAQLRDVLADHPDIIPHLADAAGTDVPTVTPMTDNETSPTEQDSNDQH